MQHIKRETLQNLHVSNFIMIMVNVSHVLFNILIVSWNKSSKRKLKVAISLIVPGAQSKYKRTWLTLTIYHGDEMRHKHSFLKVWGGGWGGKVYFCRAKIQTLSKMVSWFFQPFFLGGGATGGKMHPCPPLVLPSAVFLLLLNLPCSLFVAQVQYYNEFHSVIVMFAWVLLMWLGGLQNSYRWVLQYLL